MNRKQVVCQTERIELFLHQQLSENEQADFERHLDDCDECCRRLEQSAAAEEVWTSIRESLHEESPSRDSADCSGGSTDSAASEAGPPFGVESVLQLLAPTDDDRMLGRLGTYEVMGIIGSGGMGVVVKAFDPALNRYVAIKILSPHLGNSGAARKRFSREAQAAAAVVHDNVIEIHSVADANGLPYLVMPYVRGPSLQKRLDDDGPLSVVEILRIARQAAAGLAAAHAQGLVHRDVKPANILLADGIERVKLTDFGLARAADDASLTKTGVIAGTPQYMSPEQARGDAIDATSDLFSLGSVMYTMCTGRPPFRAETSYGILRRITDTEPRPIREINPDVPDWLCAIIRRLMSKQAEYRFASAEEVAELLQDCLAHVQQPSTVLLPQSCRSSSRGYQPLTKAHGVWKLPPRFKLIAAAAFFFALIFAGILIILELNKGTLTIESDADNVPIRITQGEKLVDRLTVSKSGESVRIAAGRYVVEIDGEPDGISVDNSTVELQRRGQRIVRIVSRNEEDPMLSFGVGAPRDTSQISPAGVRQLLANTAVDDYDRLEGTWQVVSATGKGSETYNRALVVFNMTGNGKFMVWSEHQNVSGHFLVDLDEEDDAYPRHIFMRFPDRGRQGFFEFQGGERLNLYLSHRELTDNPFSGSFDDVIGDDAVKLELRLASRLVQALEYAEDPPRGADDAEQASDESQHQRMPKPASLARMDFVVNGQVKNPGWHECDFARGLRLRDAIAHAGGLTKDAGDQVAVTRMLKSEDGGELSTFTFAVRISRALVLDMPIEPDDVITVQSALASNRGREADVKGPADSGAAVGDFDNDGDPDVVPIEATPAEGATVRSPEHAATMQNLSQLKEEKVPGTVDSSEAVPSLLEAVREFNQHQQQNAIGKSQPPLTDDEVVASIRWAVMHDGQDEISDPYREQLRHIAEQRQLPSQWGFRVVTEVEGSHGERFQSWAIRLVCSGTPGVPPYNHAIRHQLLWQLDADGQAVELGKLESGGDAADSKPLAAAIHGFNSSHRRLAGLDMPPLTEQEVIAAIRFQKLRRNEFDITDGEFARMQQIADEQRLPSDAEISIITGFQPGDGYRYDIWSVRFNMRKQVNTVPYPFTGFTIREHYVRSQSLDLDKIAWGPVAENGLQAGVRFEPRQAQYSIGQKVTPYFYHRNTGDREFDVSFPNLESGKLIAVDNAGVAIPLAQERNPKWIVGFTGLGEFGFGAQHEIRGRPIVLGDVERGDAEYAIRARLGQAVRIHFVLFNYADRGESQLRTGEVAFSMAPVRDAAADGKPARGKLDSAARQTTSNETEMVAGTVDSPDSTTVPADTGTPMLDAIREFNQRQGEDHSVKSEQVPDQFLERPRHFGAPLAKRIQGQWQLVSQIMADGDAQATPRKAFVRFERNRLYYEDSNDREFATWTVDEPKSPIHFDLKLNHSDKSGRGIIALEGGRLKLCLTDLDAPEAPRPQSFEPVRGYWHMEYARPEAAEQIPVQPKAATTASPLPPRVQSE